MNIEDLEFWMLSHSEEIDIDYIISKFVNFLEFLLQVIIVQTLCIPLFMIC